MSFLLKNRLGDDITQIIYSYTKPKSISSYRDILLLTLGGGIIKDIICDMNPEFDYEKLSNDSIFSRNIGYPGYSLFLGVIERKWYFNVMVSLKMYLVFDEWPLKAIEIIVVNTSGLIQESYLLSDKVLQGVYLHSSFYYNINDKTHLNTLELENYDRLIENSNDLANLLLSKHFDNKIALPLNHIVEEIS